MASIAKLLIIQGGRCFYCGNRLAFEDATVDHVIPRALGGDNTEANTVACCHSINQAFGNATPKEKLTAIINAGGRIECPPRPARKRVVATSEVSAVQVPAVQSPAPRTSVSEQLALPELNHPATAEKKPASASAKASAPPASGGQKQKPPPEVEPSELRAPLQEAFRAAAAANGGEKAMLTAVSVELRKKISGFAVKKYGEKTFAKLVAVLGYRVDKDWCFPPK